MYYYKNIIVNNENKYVVKLCFDDGINKKSPFMLAAL